MWKTWQVGEVSYFFSKDQTLPWMETAFLHNFPSVSFLLASAFCKRKCEIFKGLPFNFVRRATGKPPVKLFILAQSIRISELQMSLGCTQMRSCAIKDILINLLIYRHIFAACLFLKKSGGGEGVECVYIFFTPLYHHQSRAEAVQNIDFTCRLE